MGSFEIEFITPEHQLSSFGEVVPENVDFFKSRCHKADVHVHVTVVTRLFPPSVKALIKMFKMIPHYRYAQRGIVRDSQSFSEGSSIISSTPGLPPQCLRDVCCRIQHVLNAVPNVGLVVASGPTQCGLMIVPGEEEVECVRPYLSLEKTNEFYIHGHLLKWNVYEQREIGDSENTKGARDTRAHKGRIREELRQGGEAGEGITDSPPEEGLTRTSPGHRPGGYTAKHIHSGNPEDA